MKHFEDFTPADIVSTDENIGIKYEKADIVEDTLLLLRYNCPDPSCDVACLGWPDLHRHVRSVHHKKMCDLCTRNKKVFTHEHELFTDRELERHMKKGDDNPGAIDQSGFRGHPLCGFCGERFYGDDELYVHCRSKHERCFICDRRSNTQPQYYLNYDSLELHFRKDHFLCPERGCLEKKFIVFESEIDLKHHQLEEHSNTLSKDARRDARVVDMSSFDYRAPYVQERRGGGSQREGRGRGRGRDPNTDPIPASSAQPLRRDEQAFQRQMAIQSAQSVSTRTFGGQLTSTSAPAARATPGSRDLPSVAVARPSSHAENVASQLGRMELQDGDGAEVSPQEQARRLRHSAVIERATTLLQNDQIKLTRFRNAISSFRTNAISARALIDTFFALFSDASSNALGSLIREVADLYEDKAKAESLRTAWNDWRAINEDYPSLPGPSGLSGSSLPLGWAQVTSSNPPSTATTAPKSTSRVLKLKSSTAQSSRSSASRNASWGSASASSANSFPGLPNPAIGAPASSIRTAAGTVRSTPPTSQPASRGPARVLAPSGPDAFPALPPAAKPTSTIFGYGTGAVRRDVGGGTKSSGFVWGVSPAGSGTQSEARGESEQVAVGVGGAAAGGAKKKGNKGKKEVLVKWG
jgi:E3 ubiquitin-protein ligase ZNF598